MLIWKRERVAFLHCAVLLLRVTSAQRARRRICDRHQTTRFFHRIWRRPSHSICKSAFKKSLERTHSTNGILFGELTKTTHCIMVWVCNFSSVRMRFNIFLVCIGFLGAACVFACSMVDPVNARSHDSQRRWN